MKQSEDISGKMRRFPAPAPANATNYGSAAPWTPRQWHLAEQVESVCSPSKIQGPIVPGKNDHLTIRNDIRSGLLRSDKEGQDWRFVTFKIWRDIENEVLSNETLGAENLKGLQDLKRFDRSILPHLAKNITPEERCAFIESAILHLAWVANEGISSKVHLDIIRHSVNLLKKSLPEALDQAPDEYNFNKRLELVLSQVIKHAAAITVSGLNESAWELATDIARLKLPGRKIDLFEATSELFLALHDAKNSADGPKASPCYLSTYDKEGVIDRSRYEDEPQTTYQEEDEDDDEYEDSNSSEQGLNRNFFKGRSQRRDFCGEYMRTPYDQLSKKLISVMLGAPMATHSDFWIRFLEQTSMTNTFWPSAMRGLEQSNPYEFQFFTKRLIIASSQSEVAALNLMRVAALAEQSKWRQHTGFIKLVADMANTLDSSTKLRAGANVYKKYYKLERPTQDIIRQAKGRLYFILARGDEQTRE
jgi:hypothetical protein